jgi:hypothetical protein
MEVSARIRIMELIVASLIVATTLLVAHFAVLVRGRLRVRPGG